MSLSKTQMAGAALAFINLTTFAHAASPLLSPESSKILLSASTRVLKIAGYSITGATLGTGGTSLVLLAASKFLTKKVDTLAPNPKSILVQSAFVKVFFEISSKGICFIALTAAGLAGASLGLRYGIKA